MGAQCGTEATVCCASDGERFGYFLPASAAVKDTQPEYGVVEVLPVKKTLDDSQTMDSDDLAEDGSALGKPSWRYFSSEATELLEAAQESSSGQNGRPIWIFKSGSTYDGEWLGSKRHGYGKQLWPDGTIYQGEWKDNCAEGLGRFTHSDGDEYIGSWAANLSHGAGVYRSRSGNASYEGQWLADKQTGYGVELWGDGSRYEGEFWSGQKHGYGRYIWSDGDMYSGAWEINNFHGCGTHTSQGCCFQGAWDDSVIHGVGKYTWVDGRSFRGQYKSDKRDGFGILQWPASSKRYSGNWYNGRQHGQGEYINEDGIRTMQVWRHGVEVEPATRSQSHLDQI